MQNKKYIKFADEHTVEVLSLSKLDKAVEKKDRKAATYTKKNAQGEKVEYMVQWPSLTFRQIMKLNRSKAATYNKTGLVPYTSLINPHDLKEMHVFKGATAGKIMEAVKEATKKLKKKFGKGVSRKTMKSIKKGVISSNNLVNEGEFDKAIKALEKAAPKPQNLPESLQQQLTEAKESIIEAAQGRLDAIKSMDVKDAKRAIRRFISKAKKTGLANDANDFAKSLKDS